jgi:hypothetical protein
MWYIYGALFYAFVFVVSLVLSIDELDSELIAGICVAGFLAMFIWPVGLVILGALGVAFTLKKMFKKGD